MLAKQGKDHNNRANFGWTSKSKIEDPPEGLQHRRPPGPDEGSSSDHQRQAQRVDIALGYDIILGAIKYWVRIVKRPPLSDPMGSRRPDSPTDYPEKKKP